MASGVRKTINWIFFGCVSLFGLCVYSELGMRFFKGKGYFLPESQKSHLKDKNYVSDKFKEFKEDKTTILPVEPKKDIKTRPQTTIGTGSSFAPKKSAGYDWASVDEGIEPSPLGSTLTDSEPRKTVSTQPKKIQTPAPVMKTVLDTDFVIDVKSKSGSGRSYSFDLADNLTQNYLKMKISETGERKTDFGSNVYLNVVYFNPNKPQGKGMAFSVVFCQDGGFLLAPYNDTLGQYICLSKGDRITVQHNPATNQLNINGGSLAIPNAVTVNKNAPRVVEVKQIDIKPQVIQSHKNNKIPLIRTSHTR